MNNESIVETLPEANERPDVMFDFWSNVLAMQGSVTPRILPNLVFIGILSSVICFISWNLEKYFGARCELQMTPHEFIGAALAVVLVLRTNAGYERWWEARIIWGGIVNQSRNLAISALAYGPKDKKWREEFCNWVAAFPHVSRLSLRGEPPDDRVAKLIGKEESERMASEDHMPSYVALKLGRFLLEARENELDEFAFLQIDKERATLIDHIGACERISKTPLALSYCMIIRQFIAIFLLTLPLVLLHKLASEWLVPILCMAVSYPLIALDQLGLELQNPFSKSHLSHLPLDEICATIERNVLHLVSKD